MPSNEGKACDAVLRFLEQRIGAPRRELLFPDIKTFPREAQIELACSIGSERFALEHTFLEPFEGYRELDHHVQRFNAALRTRLQGILPAAHSYDVEIPINVLSQFRERRQLNALTEQVANWIESEAPSVPYDRQDRALAIVRKPTPEIPFVIALRRRDLLYFKPRLQVVSIVPREREQLRRARLERAYRDKAKLSTFKRLYGGRTVLVLEDNDIQGSNQFLIGDAIEDVEKGQRRRPDEVYLISTEIEPWHLYPIRVGRRWVFKSANLGDRWREFDPAQLRDVTTEGRRQANATF